MSDEQQEELAIRFMRETDEWAKSEIALRLDILALQKQALALTAENVDLKTRLDLFHQLPCAPWMDHTDEAGWVKWLTEKIAEGEEFKAALSAMSPAGSELVTRRVQEKLR